jgi:TonB family protein
MSQCLRFIAGLLVGASVSLSAGAWQTRTPRLDEWSLRANAISTPKPAYPKASADRKATGVVVASIVVGTDGRTVEVAVVEAPDDGIARAVRDGVMRWTFKPLQAPGQPEPSGMRGLLTFYFRIVRGRPVVLDPDELPEDQQPPRPRPRTPNPDPGTTPPPKPARPPAAPTVTSHAKAREIDAAEFQRLLGAAVPAFVVDVRERDEFQRDQRDGAVNIPYNEVRMRARAELPRDRDIVIDCSRGELFPCRIGGTFLLELGFERVSVFIP